MRVIEKQEFVTVKLKDVKGGEIVAMPGTIYGTFVTTNQHAWDGCDESIADQGERILMNGDGALVGFPEYTKVRVVHGAFVEGYTEEDG